MVPPKAVTKHSATGGLPTFTSNPAVPTPGTAFTLSWTIPNYKQQGFTSPKIDCAPNYSDGPNLTDGGQDVSAQNQVDGSGNASGSFQATVNRKEQYVFTLSVQATKGAAFSKQLTLNAGFDASTQFQFTTADGQQHAIDQTVWHTWFDQNIPTVLSAANDKIQSQIVGWVNAENQTLGVTSSDPNSTWANIKAGILKATGKAVTAFAATTLSTPSQISAKAQSDFTAASAMVNQGRDHPDICLNGMAQVDQAFTNAVVSINDFQTALDTGGQRLITVIQTARWVTTIVLVVASGGAATPLVAGDIPMVASPLTTIAVGAAIGGGTEAATALGKMLINCAGGESVTGEQIKEACLDTVKGAVLGAIFAGVASNAPDLGEGLLGREPTEEEEKIIEQAVEKILDGSAEQLTELAKEKEKPDFLEAAGNTVGLQLEANLPASMQAAIDAQKKKS